jgi:hypothetical protein
MPVARFPFDLRGRRSVALAFVLLLPSAGCGLLVDMGGLTGGPGDAGTATSRDGGWTWSSQDDDAAPTSPPGDVDAGAGGSTSADAGQDGALADTGGAASGDAGDPGCGPTNTTAQCGSCGTACDTTTGSPSCNGTSCTYACNPGRSDCDLQAPDTNGCECATPACCGGSCQTIHSDGVGQNFYDCNPLGTNTDAEATEACVAYALSVGGKASDCTDGWNCQGQPYQVCFNTYHSGVPEYCWAYDAPKNDVFPNYCPGSPIGTWN